MPTPAVTSFTCPTQTVGSTKIFTDNSMQFSFSYPASWTENQCQRFAGDADHQTIMIGNLFSVTITPRNGQTIQQWVNSQSNQYEVVTLGALTVPMLRQRQR